MLLAGDIGGTKTVLALFATREHADDIKRRPLLERTFPSAQYQSLEVMIAEFLDEDVGQDDAVTDASFGVAGPVVDGRAEVTNLPWIIDAAAISEQFCFRVHLLNDLEAIATAVPHLEATDVVTLREGTPRPHGAIGVVAPGTGLGEAFLVWNGTEYEAHPSEGGHTAFGPTTDEQLALLTYWMPRMGHVSYERVCSGLGIPNIYTFLRETGRYHEPDWLRAMLEDVRDPTPVIVRTAVASEAAICVATLEMFMEILGDEAGNMALCVLATGGIYLGGGIPPRILPQLQKGPFLKFFTDKGRFSDMMEQVPVHVIYNPKAGLYGAAYDALRLSHA